MLERLVALSLKYKILVLIVFAVVAVLGYRAVRTLPIDAFPDVTPVQVNVYTEASGLAAEDVEQLLTTPVESALAGLPKVQEIRSVSLFGLSYVAVYFDDDMGIYFARQLVNERLQQVGDRLPAGYGKPEMGPNTSGLGQVFWYTVERADEIPALFKTTPQLAERLRTRIEALHSYDLPVVETWPAGASAAVRNWIAAETG